MNGMVSFVARSSCVATIMLVSFISVAAAAVGDGMLREQDVGLDRAKSPHTATLIRASQNAPGSCDDPDTREYEGRLVAFGNRAGPSLSEYVLDFASAGEAGSTFDEFKADDQAAVACGATDFRTAGSVEKAPKGVGTRGYTFANKVTIAGKKVTATSICAVQGKHLMLLTFIAWPKSSPSPATIAKKADDLLTPN